ncbi:membrane-spanning 4-domains subfamily A member 4A-like [Latimeria chalumnae]|uniref:membrane-spanning 4-domains subfamily A member 4A-like n=1 Tax=Latimeria chalumnae TaxID=7897 RepID=UPI0003C126B5|nr:PREDICTED: membrane-spanning 4-domains subfamily A member 4A-like [Latimeria chalumnae]|eukprot:XP_005998396.1 PREDICTED: membrane-spanning 4-domains subfamily A member 4A-like [Latimeria chalumnae]
MTSTVSTAGGMVVISQVIPQGDLANIQATAASVANSNFRVTEHLQKFLKGEPKALGVTQILTGIITIILGIILVCTPLCSFPALVGAPFWSGIFFITSGSLSVASANKPKVTLVKATLGMNIISAVFAGITIILYMFDFDYIWSYHCSNFQENSYYYYETCTVAKVLCTGSKAILLILSLLEFAVSISVSAFSCKGVCYENTPNTVIYIQNTHQGPVAVPGPSDLPNLGAPLPTPPAYEESQPMVKSSVLP